MIIALIIDYEDRKTRGSTRKWIRRREEEGMYANLVQELLVEDTKTYMEMMRMSYKSFKKILGFIEPHITPKGFSRNWSTADKTSRKTSSSDTIPCYR